MLIVENVNCHADQGKFQMEDTNIPLAFTNEFAVLNQMRTSAARTHVGRVDCNILTRPQATFAYREKSLARRPFR
jgi:hypothetical protein